MRYILWVVALLEAYDVTNNGRHLGFNQVKTARNGRNGRNGRHLGFYQELEIRLRLREMVTF